jgi:hypothetical protein
VSGPAITLMVTAGFGLLIGLAGLAASKGANGDNFVVVFNLVQLIASGFIFFGALKMKNLERRGLAIAASIVAMIPGLTCLFAIPVGIWALVVLCKAEVKAAFR